MIACFQDIWIAYKSQSPSYITNNEQVEFEIQNTVSFTLTIPKMKYLGLNLIKYVQDLYEENCKTLMREIKV